MDRSSKALQELDSFAEPPCTELSVRSHFMPIEMRMESGGLHAYFNRRQASPSTAASGPGKTSGSGQRAPALDLGVRCGVPSFA